MLGLVRPKPASVASAIAARASVARSAPEGRINHHTAIATGSWWAMIAISIPCPWPPTCAPASAIPSVKAFLTSPGLFSNISAHWYDQLPDTPALELLGSDRSSLPTRVYERYPELVGTVFDRLALMSQLL